MSKARTSSLLVALLVGAVAADRMPSVSVAAASPIVRSVTPTVAELSSVIDYDCDYDCNTCEFCVMSACHLPGHEVVQDVQGAGWRSVAAYSCTEVNCPARSNDCPPEDPEEPGGGTVAATDEQMEAVWGAVARRDVGALQQMLEGGRYLELNVERSAIQVFGCRGVVTAHIPLEPVVLAELTE